MKRVICLLLTITLLCGLFAGLCTVSAAEEFRVSDAGIDFIKSFEGFLKYKVWDNTQYSIGYGCVCGPNDYPNGITEAEAEALLRKHLANIEARLNKFIRENNCAFLQHQFDALVSFTYNTGANWMNSDSRIARCFLADAQTSRIELPSAIGVWCHVGKAVAPGLVNRRVREIQLLIYGDYTGSFAPDFNYVQFDAAGGELPEADIYFYEVGRKYEIFTTPTKDNLKFLGWYKGDGTKLNASDVVTGDLRVTARWENAKSASDAFTDISETDWFYGPVDDLYNNSNAIAGYGDGTLRPHLDVKIGEALKLIFVASGYGEQPSTMLDPHWASGYRSLAISKGIFEYNEEVNLNQPASRALVAEIAATAMNLTETEGAEDAFVDTQDPNVLALYLRDIVIGSLDAAGNRYYKPNDCITRAEIFTIVSRIQNSQKG